MTTLEDFSKKQVSNNSIGYILGLVIFACIMSIVAGILIMYDFYIWPTLYLSASVALLATSCYGFGYFMCNNLN